MSRNSLTIYHFFFVFFLCSTTSKGQDKNLPWSVTISTNAINTSESAGGDQSWFSNHFSRSFKANEYWNYTPYLSHISFSRHLKNNWSLSFSGSYNKINRYVVFIPAASSSYTVINPGNLFYYGIGSGFKYSLMRPLKSKWIDPSVLIGGGYTFLGDSSFGTLNLGLGLRLWFTDRIGIDLSSQYNKSFGERDVNSQPDAPSYVQHTFGLVFKFGGKDSDNDGFYDFQDACPEASGLIQYQGCPDSDGDGIIDKNDLCPYKAGNSVNLGCPDTDGDDVFDNEDNCPILPGNKLNKGCPLEDTDSDGVPDNEDNCPSIAGIKVNKGCPDSDGDGIVDIEDKCPTVYGIVTNGGCPELQTSHFPSQAVLNTIEVSLKRIYFHSNRSVLINDVSTILEEISKILLEYPQAKFRLEGHTDSTGSDLFNQNLSQARADLIRSLLIKHGVNPLNIVAVGFGESKPVDSNKSPKGRARNRRVVIVLIK